VIKETKIALKHVGAVDPLNLEEYTQKGGFLALEKALSMDPEEIISELEESGLRGRGGGGFPTGMKVKFTARAEGYPKYVICNADEGEPGTYKDRIIMEQNPHIMIEGMIIAAYAIKAERGYIYLRGEYEDSIEKLKKALKDCYKKGYLGKNIMNSNYSLDMDLRIGAGSYLCGEELTLLESLEGKRGYPRIKPPFPANVGVFNQPTLINNVETFANMPHIISEGALSYKQLGTEKSPGTKIFTISGDIEKPGYYEVSMGITLRQLIDELAGGMKNGSHFKAALLGGAAGTFVNSSVLDTPMGFDSLKEKGATLGSGAVMVMNKDRSVFDMTDSILEFFKHESCGKCVPCRVGTSLLVKIMKQAKEKESGHRTEFLEKMKSEAQYMQENSLCPLGGSPILPIGSVDQYFKEIF
jgi:NADH:ubiquinone oxidoreductase subunit F (NADH-binding)